MALAQQPSTSLDIPPKLILLLVAVALFTAFAKGLEARARRRRREARKQRQREYQRYLRSDGWKLRRQPALDRAGGFCEDCGARSRLEVHHLTYKRIGSERPKDLVAVCERCHGVRHRGKRNVLDWVGLALLRRWRIWRYRRTHRKRQQDVLTCSNCGGRVPEAKAEAVGWRYWSDDVGELHPFCANCAARKFARPAPASLPGELGQDP
jgi:hypothetical protein